MPRSTDKSVLTSKSQVTIPKKVREFLGIGPGDQVRFKVEGGAVRIEHIASDVAASYGAVKPGGKPEDYKKIRAKVESDVGRDAASRK